MSQKFNSLQCVRGTRDLLPEQNLKYRKIEETAYQCSLLYGYGEIETPIFESSQLFHRSLGETSDVIHKETYTFLDRGGDSLTLRPEGTAGVVRSFLSEGMAQNLPLKFYYSGPMFRYERPQKGRYRQFYQFGVEALGYDSFHTDAECLSLAYDILDRLGLKSKVILEINSLGNLKSRTNYRDLLVQYFSKNKEKLSQESLVRLDHNPLRILDSKSPQDQSLFPEAPKIPDSLDEDSRKFFDGLIEELTRLGLSFQLNPTLVRGLDYYCHTVFEFTTQLLGSQNAVLSGGRYDGLSELLGGPRTPAIGWASGVDRLMDLVELKTQTEIRALVAIAPADEAGERGVLALAQRLRQNNIPVECLYSGNLGKKMKRANKLGASHVLILGQNELQNRQVTLKTLSTGEQKNVELDQIEKFIHPL